MAKKKILILCQYFYPEYVSSATLPTQMAEDLMKKGIDVDVICGWPYEYSKKKRIKKRETYYGINIERLKYTQLNSKSKIGRIVNFFSLFLSFVTKMPKMMKYDEILVYSNPPILPLIPDVLYRCFKKPYSFVVYDIAPDNALKTGATRPGSMIDRLMKYINKHVYHNARNIIVLGNEMKHYLLQNNIATREDHIHVIPNWYDTQNLSDDIVRNSEFKMLRTQYEKILLYSGNMGQLQDMETLIAFIKENKDDDTTLTIFCGHGKKQHLVKDAVQKYQLKHVRVYDFLTGSDYADVLKIADACFASLIPEGVGLGVPSKNYGYLAAKKPLILIMDKQSDIVRHVEAYDAGIQVANGDASAITQFIHTHSRDALKTKGVHAYQLFENEYTRQKNTNKYYELLK
ncbi:MULTISPECIES: glycosyltransferase family 4 protein [Staphylococcus]|uniref:glycosyltransferase family 4 protein n=1 Tax=Staphylococcus TaxID=1279 RepID=UPI000D1C04E8|nr:MULTISPECIES: glycosyltransferase family 4 protein [Staphylococcus]NHM73943.1 glycosyltransferase family 4 protein [Staphylococcus sp. 11007852]NJH83809.1 glycosyltransferase [Staphylococcus agnetis]NJH85470.1 glycosyltransferase [Staphylococcus agnetis]NJI14859.1 glycosyltransferase [Staphylococcus agnetis]PTH39821.1 glycosyltransferase WbuB [Staphylococcus agnetis]